MLEPYKQAYERERQARILAERLLDNKTRVLYDSNIKLESMIEALESTQAQLVQSEKMASLGQLAAGVAHEINNPIGFSLSNLSLLNDYIDSLLVLDTFVTEHAGIENLPFVESYNNLRQEKDIVFIRQEIEDLLRESIQGLHRVRDIVTNLKKVSHSGCVEKERCDVNKMLGESLKVVWSELKYKITLEENLDEVPDIHCHVGEISQVFINMFVNAAQACEQHGEITVTSSAVELNRRHYVLVKISDNGHGMNNETMKKIFDPFYTTKPVGKGTGLGLSISHGIIEKHGGKIEVTSKEGIGTTFSIFLPSADMEQ